MMVVRPVREGDLDGLVRLADKAGFGLTSLPADRDLLARRVAQSLDSFRRRPDQPRGDLYMFVMEDVQSAEIVGTSCIVSKVGGFEPFWAYKIRTTVHESNMLQIRKEIPTLHLVSEHSGPCEIGGLFLSPDYRKHGNGRLLSLFRFLFMAERPESFESVVIAEMRGVVDEEGHSPFWEALGRHFFDMEFPKADYLSVKDKRFIADLMPTCPIYVPLLPESAREVIGRVHKATEPALKMLMDEGFGFSDMVDIFEAGPIISCRLEQLRIVKESRSAVVEEVCSGPTERPGFIIINTGEDFRACLGAVTMVSAEGVQLDAGLAEALSVRVGDRVRFSPARPSEEGRRPPRRRSGDG